MSDIDIIVVVVIVVVVGVVHRSKSHGVMVLEGVRMGVVGRRSRKRVTSSVSVE